MKTSQVLKVWQKQIKPGQVLEVEILPESFWYVGIKGSKKVRAVVEDTMLQFQHTVLHIFTTFAHPDTGKDFKLCITVVSTPEQFAQVHKHWTGYVVRKAPKFPKTQCAASA